MVGFSYEDALAGCARRDGAALRALYDRDAAFLLGVALRIVRQRDVANDVLHDAIVDVWQRASTYDPTRGPARAWIVSVVRHRAFKALRRGSREIALDAGVAEAVPDDAPDAFARLATSEDGKALHRCLDQLQPARRAVILLAYVDGLTQPEIARRLGAPLGTVKAWTRRSLMALRECLA